MVTNVKKKSTAGGGKFSYKYTDLATIHEELERQGIEYYQFTKYDEQANADYIYTVIIRDGEPGKELRGVKIVEGNTLAGGNAAQEYGSALTYARRYSLLLALGWATEDDDAQRVGKSAPAKYSVDFNDIRAKIAKINTIEELEVYWRSLKLSEKAAKFMKIDFAKRKEQLEAEAQVPKINLLEGAKDGMD